MAKFTFTSIEQVNAYISDLGTFEPSEEWTCPVCETKNFGVYHARSTRCPECKDFVRPAVPCPLSTHQNGNTLGISNELIKMNNEINDYKHKIRDLEGEINNYENYIQECKNLKELLKKMVPDPIYHQ
jgi:hypothetical protein